MGMGFFMGMFVGGSVTLLHAGMAGGLKGLDRMAFKRSANNHSAVKRRQSNTVTQQSFKCGRLELRLTR